MKVTNEGNLKHLLRLTKQSDGQLIRDVVDREWKEGTGREGAKWQPVMQEALKAAKATRDVGLD